MFNCVLMYMYMLFNLILGADRYYDNLEAMFGFRINPYMKVSWKFMAPIFCLVGFQFTF